MMEFLLTCDRNATKSRLRQKRRRITSYRGNIISKWVIYDQAYDFQTSCLLPAKEFIAAKQKRNIEMMRRRSDSDDSQGTVPDVNGNVLPPSSRQRKKEIAVSSGILVPTYRTRLRYITKCRV